MAQCLCFYNLTNTYFSISPTEYYRNLQDELWGCFKYIGMPWDMIMSLPIQDRRYFIQKHNAEQDALSSQNSNKGNVRTYEGSAINAFAKNEQNNRKNSKRG